MATTVLPTVRAERVQTSQRGKAPAKQGDSRVLCDDGLKETQRERGGGNRRKGWEGGGVAHRKRASHLAKAQHRVKRGQRTRRVLRAHCDGVLKNVIERERGEGKGVKRRGGGRGEVARRKRVTHLATTQQRAEQAQKEQRVSKAQRAKRA